MSEVDLPLAFLAGVVMGGTLDRSRSRSSSMRGSTDCAGMGDERGDDAADRRRADVYSSARIGAAAALTLVLVVLLVFDVAIPDYDISLGILLRPSSTTWRMRGPRPVRRRPRSWCGSSRSGCLSPTTPPNGTTSERATAHDGQASRSLVKSLSSISHAWSRVW
jgi:hypothetical protein